MAYDRQFLSVDFLFQDISSDEIAVTGLNFSQIGFWTGAVAALGELDVVGSDGADIASEMFTLINNSNLFWGTFSQLYGVKVAAIGTDGLYLTDPKIHAIAAPLTGTSNTTVPQSTVVCSLRSGSVLGSANFGRMYLPHTRLGIVANTSSSNVATTDVVVAAFADFVRDVKGIIDTAITGSVDPFIMSNQSPKPSKPVLQVRVGTVTDTQRRRRNRITELYSTEVL